jgi:hypothetical protein
VREDLEKSAAMAGRSLSEEMEHRIELSLAQRDPFIGLWGWDIYPIFQSLASALWRIESMTTKRWWEDEQTWDLFRRTAAKVGENYRRIISQDLLEFKPQSWRLSLDQPPDEVAEAIAAAVGIGPPIGPKEDKTKHEARKAHALAEARARMASSNARPLTVDDEVEQ